MLLLVDSLAYLPLGDVLTDVLRLTILFTNSKVEAVLKDVSISELPLSCSTLKKRVELKISSGKVEKVTSPEETGLPYKSF